MKLWEIQYSKDDGPTESIQREFEEEPSRESAAQQLRNALFQPFIIPDTPRGLSRDITVWQLEKSGVKIIDIIEIKNE